MKVIGKLVKRNSLVYLKNRSNVFFSLMASFIVIILMLVFLGDTNINSITNSIKDYSQTSDSVLKDNVTHLIYAWIAAGLVIVNAISVSISVVGIMVDDQDNNRLTSMFVAPIKRSYFVISYAITSFLVTVVFCVLTIVVSEVYIVSQGGTLLTVAAFGQLLFYTIINSFTFSALSFLLCLFVKTSSAFSSLGSIICTLSGFVAGIYLPVGVLPKMVAKVLKVLPVLPGASLLREAFMNDITKDVFKGMPSSVLADFKEEMGVSVMYGSTEASVFLRVLIVVGSGIIFLALATLLMRKKTLSDR